MTVAAVSFLSVATRMDNVGVVSAETQEPQETQDEVTLSAVINEKHELNFFALIAFLLIVFGTVFGVLMFFRNRDGSDSILLQGQNYNPREDVVFKQTIEQKREKNRVKRRKRRERI